MVLCDMQGNNYGLLVKTIKKIPKNHLFGQPDSLRASSPIWASEASLARTRERGAEERSPLPLAASPLARAFSRDSFNSPK